MTPTAIMSSLRRVLCPLCNSGKHPGSAFCDSCLAALPWSIRRTLCGPEAEYVAAMDVVLTGRGVGETVGETDSKTLTEKG